MNNRKLLSSLTLWSLLLYSCSEKHGENFLGSAIVSGNTYQITAATQGNIIKIFKDEGEQVISGELVAIIDTIPLVFKLNEANAGKAEIEATIVAKYDEIKALEIDIDGLKRDFDRLDTLAQRGAIPRQQRDNLQTKYQSSLRRLQANQNVITSYKEKIKGQVARIDQLKDQIKNCYLYSPSQGVIQTRYRNLMEVVGPGNPIFEISQFDTLQADFFVPQPLLGALRYGQELKIRVDMQSENGGPDEMFIPAKISWISQEAEFSPKNIQTRESRNELVFKIRAIIANPDGVLKRGLPVEVYR